MKRILIFVVVALMVAGCVGTSVPPTVDPVSARFTETAVEESFRAAQTATAEANFAPTRAAYFTETAVEDLFRIAQTGTALLSVAATRTANVTALAVTQTDVANRSFAAAATHTAAAASGIQLELPAYRITALMEGISVDGCTLEFEYLIQNRAAGAADVVALITLNALSFPGVVFDQGIIDPLSSGGTRTVALAVPVAVFPENSNQTLEIRIAHEAMFASIPRTVTLTIPPIPAVCVGGL